MADLRAYKAGPIEPAALPGDNFLVMFNGKYSLYKVAAVEQLPPSPATTVNVGAIAAGASINNYDPSASLNMPNGTVAQLRFLLLDDALVTVKQGAGAVRFATKSSQAQIGPFAKLVHPDDALTEIAWFEDQFPTFQVQNITNYALALCRLVFYGWRFLLIGKDGIPKAGVHTDPIAEFGSPAEAKLAGNSFTVINEGGFVR